MVTKRDSQDDGDDNRTTPWWLMTRLEHQEKCERYRENIRRQLGFWTAPETPILEAMWKARPQRFRRIKRLLFWAGVRPSGMSGQ